MIEALRNENRFLQEEVDRYRMQNKELMEFIFKAMNYDNRTD